ncbi:hypothetical protein Pcinc_017086 [Petrolisthes cinctipes]|uniref:Uncharacterized protein n=1 Tax=Petrolisthes cinctipes TaxID=88211 RepID=A0AAE1FRF4_PETCI|nr:hypothetical protein Pcinc_017086 [Petrolisthes cinctipes]
MTRPQPPSDTASTTPRSYIPSPTSVITRATLHFITPRRKMRDLQQLPLCTTRKYRPYTTASNIRLILVNCKLLVRNTCTTPGARPARASHLPLKRLTPYRDLTP